jgi:PPOX class probable F420-dependent enzyme
VDQEQRRQFVRDHRTCIFGYGRQEHGPAMTVVYYVMDGDGDDMLISTMAARGKARAVTRDGKVSLCVLDEQWPLSYVQVYGQAVVEQDRELAVDVLTRVIGLMAGETVPDSRRSQIEQMAEDEQRVVIRVTPYATFVTPPRHVWQMSDIDTLTHHTSMSLPW